ncbi:hypothetical protein [Kushneria phosphatilytica]|uniref:Uncharacterized protein n=1 Tax=Kushneria phosphatilytica TaxID=657387 RepID=A0A1S1NTW0_9GAMM|nr:hypothetical protein [Kushneria phosphatilytica]OHV12984.1 hypothetical protein BH688_02995 [Kushneria phosphatilytica]QEL10854.1 hypothetical protein FY550_06760 [Kushneria phosphatilytica]
MNQKPIEPGCLALTTGHVNHAENRHKAVTVLYDSTDEHDSPPCTVWCVEGAVYSDHFGAGKADFLERDLLRIDGGEPETSEIEEDREVPA